jgi:hypothetical protein
MSVQIIKATAPSVKRSVEFEYDFGSDLAAATKKFGADVVFAKFVDAATISLQALARTKMVAGGGKSGKEGYKSDATIKSELKSHALTIGRTGDPVKKKDRLLRSFNSMTTAERAAIMAEMTKQVTPGKPVLVKAKAKKAA